MTGIWTEHATILIAGLLTLLLLSSSTVHAASCAPSVNNPQYITVDASQLTYTLSSYDASQGTGDNVLVVTTHHENNDVTPTSVTFDGNNMTLIDSATGSGRVTSMWYLLDPPAVTGDVVVTYDTAPSNRAAVTAQTLNCIKQIAPTNAQPFSHGGVDPLNNNVTTVFDNSLVLESMMDDQGTAPVGVTQGPDQVELHSFAWGANSSGGVSYRSVPTADTVTMGWDFAAASNGGSQLMVEFINVDTVVYDCNNPDAIEGTVFYNADQNVPQVCTGSGWIALGVLNPAAGGGSCSNPSAVEGAIVYNNDFDVLQYCDGSNWIALFGQVDSCVAPALCLNIGDVCDDGNAGNNPDPVFAGFMLYGDENCEPLYVAQNDQGSSVNWKNVGTGDDMDPTSQVDGRANQDQVVPPADGTFPAFDLCYNLTDGGFTDWYLPAREELQMLWRNRTAIGNFTSAYYWPSTENATGGISIQLFDSNGGFQGTGKTDNERVRCVRRD